MPPLLPVTVETKLARLRVSQGGRRNTGPGRGAPRSASYGSGQRSRQRKAHNTVLEQEQLPAARPAPAGELRVIAELELTEFATAVQTPGRVPTARKSPSTRSSKPSTHAGQGG